ncbi:FkbM family methyltransferase [Synechococcus sp. CS-1324]|uniref:FkbM family methyltransferase n=1 Tax=Synechococcus sp. CS-1324 TaxID=2847980 RepID=UPI000DB315B2|nr:FkbM family methyltransferase [Synechococcus sp. CS-1324]MCT0229486.1 FkbM family methyltransferase [Synechococcus sp. CS-1324]PZV04870.1 MAG: hypothetical protein DCF23_04975 [Cyanobium sp.]
MTAKASIKAFLSFLSDYADMPFSPRKRQFPRYVWSYLASAMARRTGTYSSSLAFQFKRQKTITISLQPEHFGMAKGILQDCEYDNLPLKASPKTIMDLGANIGLGAVVFHGQSPEAEILCVEADPRNVQLLLRNLKDNGIPAHVVAAAIGPEQGLLSLRIGQDSTCSTLVDASVIHPGMNAEVKVPVVSMDQLLEVCGWSRIDLLKIDIEGAEEELLCESPHWLEKVGAIVMEIHPNTTPERIAGYLRPYGFVLEKHGEGREPVYVASKQTV